MQTREFSWIMLWQGKNLSFSHNSCAPWGKKMLCLAVPTKFSPFNTASVVWGFLPQMKKINLQKTNTQTPSMLSNPSGCFTDALPLLGRKQRAKRQAGKPFDFKSHQQMLQSETQSCGAASSKNLSKCKKSPRHLAET